MLISRVHGYRKDNPEPAWGEKTNQQLVGRYSEYFFRKRKTNEFIRVTCGSMANSKAANSSNAHDNIGDKLIKAGTQKPCT